MNIRMKILLSVLVIASSAINLTPSFAQTSVAVIDEGMTTINQPWFTLQKAGSGGNQHGVYVSDVIHYYAPTARVIGYDCGVPEGIDMGCAADSVVAATNAGAQIINLSFVLYNPNESTLARWQPALEHAAAAGVIVYAASGNNPTTSGFPATHPLTISVGYDARQSSQIIGDEVIPYDGGECTGSSCTTALVSALAANNLTAPLRAGRVTTPVIDEAKPQTKPGGKPTPARPAKPKPKPTKPVTGAAAKTNYSIVYKRYHKRAEITIKGKKGLYRVKIGNKTYAVQNKNGQARRVIKLQKMPRTVKVQAAGAKKWSTARVITV